MKVLCSVQVVLSFLHIKYDGGNCTIDFPKFTLKETIDCRGVPDNLLFNLKRAATLGNLIKVSDSTSSTRFVLCCLKLFFCIDFKHRVLSELFLFSF